jgi:hypothetical protein
MCYIDNSVSLQSYIRNVNKHFWQRCRGGSQYVLSIYRLHGITLASIISLTDLSATLCLFMVFIGSCMIGFNLPTNYHSDQKSLIRKSRSRLSSPGSSGSHVRDIVNKFQGSPPPQISQLRLVPTSRLVQKRTSEMAASNLNWLSSTRCSKVHSVARHWWMVMLIFITSWSFQHIHCPRSDSGCGTSSPLSIFIARKGETMVLFQ